MILFVIAITLSLTVSCICSILEACLLSLSTTDIARIAEKKPGIAEIWRGFKENIQKPIAVILITNTLAHTIGASVSGAQFNTLFGSKYIWVYSLVFSFVMIQWTEILPKSLAVRHNRFFAVLSALPLRYTITLFRPLLLFMEWINRPFEGQAQKRANDAVGDITVLAKFASVHNMITREQEDIVSRSLKLSTAKIRDIMVERDEIKFLSTDMSMTDALIESHIHHHTRYLLAHQQNLDDIIGFVNVKDIVSALQINPKDPSLKGISRPIVDIHDDQNVTQLLKTLTKGYQHMAVVRDAQGRTVGLVTLEDVVEAIVGDIEDEYDVLPTYVYKINDMRYLAGGGVPMTQLREKTGFDLPELSLAVNDWLFQQSAKPPAVETKIKRQNFVFIIRKMRRSKIHEIIVEKRT